MATPLRSVLALRTALADPATDAKEAFAIAKGIASIANGVNTVSARELVIRALERKELFSQMPGVLDSLIRSVGLFPYADPTVLSSRDRLAFEYHRPDIGLANSEASKGISNAS